MSDSKAPATERDKTALRKLGEELFRIGNLPVQQEKAELWRRLNDREPVRPMVYINEEPWPELASEELTCVSEDPFLRQIETSLRRTLYRWRHYPVDNIIRPVIECPKAWSSTGIGMAQQGERIFHSAVAAQSFTPQLTEMADIDKIKMPEVRYDAEETTRRHELLKDIFEGVAPVAVTGIRHIWFTPWDNLIRLVSIEDVMMDMLDRPEFIDALVDRYVDAKMHELDQIERLGLLEAGACNVRVGSGAYGYTKELPSDPAERENCNCADLWGCGNAQIFSEVSPDMHWEFSLKHEMRWLDRWGMTYYGCCEPLHLKIGIMKRIRNLRKISVSPWFDIPKGLELGAGDYVLSVKPNPAILAEDGLNETRARQEIRTLLDQAEGCQVEFIMKDISTVNNDPPRLWRWAQIAMEEVQK